MSLDLAGSFDDSHHARLAIYPLDGAVAHEAHATVDLHRSIGGAPKRLGGEQLDHRRLLRDRARRHRGAWRR